MEKAMTALRHLPETQEQVANFVTKVCDEALDGYTDLERFGEQLLYFEKAVKEIKDRLKGHIAEVVLQNPKDSRLQIGTRTTYDYKADSRWQELDKAKRDHEGMLKSLKSEVVDPATGEVNTPPVKKVSEFIQLKK